MPDTSVVASVLERVVREIPAHVPPRLRVLCVVAGAERTLHYCPFMVEVAAALGRQPSTLSQHVASLVEEGLLIHTTGAHRCGVTDAGRARAAGMLRPIAVTTGPRKSRRPRV